MFANPLVSRLNSEAFTLVEMLMAMLVMTVGLLGLLQCLNVAYKHSQKDTLRKEATLLAEERMHDWCRRRFDSISCSTPPAPPIPLRESGDKLVSGAPLQFKVTRQGKSLGSNTKKLEVKVEWTIKGEPGSHEISTLRTKRGDE